MNAKLMKWFGTRQPQLAVRAKMPLSLEDRAKLLVRRANLMDWIEEAQSQLNEVEFVKNTIGYRICLEEVEDRLREGGVSLDS